MFKDLYTGSNIDVWRISGYRTTICQPQNIYLYQQHMAISGTQGRMPLSLGRMPFVTKDIQVWYSYGVGRMALVTKYIQIVLSHLLSLVTWLHRLGLDVTQPIEKISGRPWDTPSPFWRVETGKWREDPAQKFAKNSELKNAPVNIDFNNRVGNEYIRGDGHTILLS